MADETFNRDQNHVPVAGAITDNAAEETRMWRIDDATKGIIVTVVGGSIGGGTGTYYTVSGVINGVNTAFSIPVAVGSDFLLFLARQPQMLTTDFTYVAGVGTTTITYAVAPDASLNGQPHVAYVVS